jgi:competence protein ComEA
VRAAFSVGLAQLVGGGQQTARALGGLPHARSALDAGVAPPAEPGAAPEAAPLVRLPCAPTPPAAAEKSGRQAAPAGAPHAAAAHALTPDGRVILNRAGLAELRRLPGIGAKRAEAILSLRQRLGRFRRASDLLRIKGIGPRLLERISPHLVLDE